MKRLILLLPAYFIFLFPVFCQTKAKNTGDSFYINKDPDSNHGLNVTYKNYGFTTISIIVRDSLKQLLEEYSRYDDSTFLFVGYDKNQKQNRTGLLKLSNEIERIDTIKKPDNLKDPTGTKGIFKDTSLFTYKYIKQSSWKETDTAGKIWKGYYGNGVREGKWEQGYFYIMPHTSEAISDVMFDNFRPQSVHYFKKGIEVPNENLKIFWPKIKGIWQYRYDIDSVTVILRKEKFMSPSSFIWEFTSDSTFKGRRHKKDCLAFHCMEFYEGKWHQQGDKLIFEGDNKIPTILLLDLTEYEMTVRFIDR